MFRSLKFLLVTLCLLVVVLFLGLQLKSNTGVFTFSRVPSHEQVRVQNQSLLSQDASANPIPPDNVLEKMSHKEVQSFYHSYINSPQITCRRVERMGKITDGGWELCDDPLYRPQVGSCLVYSYGISFDFSFDDDMVAYGCEVHAFDPSMNVTPHLHGHNVFFHPTGVGARNETVPSVKSGPWQLYTMGQNRQLLQHTHQQRQLDMVKMDVEGYELDALGTALDEGSLSDVRQLAFETHVGWSNSDPTKEEYLKFLRLLRKVYDHGFRIYLTHRNYMFSAFNSQLTAGKKRVHCHEVHTVNVRLQNTVKPDGSVVGDGLTSEETRSRWHQQQVELLNNEKIWYQNFRTAH